MRGSGSEGAGDSNAPLHPPFARWKEKIKQGNVEEKEKKKILCEKSGGEGEGEGGLRWEKGKVRLLVSQLR